MNLQLVEQITKKQLRSDIPEFKAGDTLKVYVKLKKVTNSVFSYLKGFVSQGKGSGISETFTVRKIFLSSRC